MVQQGASQIERLRSYFLKLPPKTLSLLTAEFEKSLARGENVAMAELVLGELRKVMRGPDSSERPRLDDLQRIVFAALDPFLVDADATRPGQIKRSSLTPIWTWLTNSGVPDAAQVFARDFTAAKQDGRIIESEQALRRFQLAAAGAIAELLKPQSEGLERQRTLGRVGAPAVVEDLPAVQLVFTNRDALEAFRSRLPRIFSNFDAGQVASVRAQLEQLPSLQNTAVLPLVIKLLVERMTSPWQIVRLAVSYAGSDEEGRIATTPYALAVNMALQDLTELVAQLSLQIRRGRFDESAHHLKSLHDGLRDLRTELDFRPDSNWGRQLSAIRADIANALTSEIDSVPGRVRRLLRHRSDKDINAGARLDASEADETVALVNFVTICRNYASELAINEVALRSFTDLQHYLETATESLVESLRTGDARVRAFRQLQVEIAIRFCEVMFGHDYASLMNKAAEVALSGERKPSRAGA